MVRFYYLKRLAWTSYLFNFNTIYLTHVVSLERIRECVKECSNNFWKSQLV